MKSTQVAEAIVTLFAPLAKARARRRGTDISDVRCGLAPACGQNPEQGRERGSRLRGDTSHPRGRPPAARPPRRTPPAHLGARQHRRQASAHAILCRFPCIHHVLFFPSRVGRSLQLNAITSQERHPGDSPGKPCCIPRARAKTVCAPVPPKRGVWPRELGVYSVSLRVALRTAQSTVIQTRAYSGRPLTSRGMPPFPGFSGSFRTSFCTWDSGRRCLSRKRCHVSAVRICSNERCVCGQRWRATTKCRKSREATDGRRRRKNRVTVTGLEVSFDRIRSSAAI